MKVVRFLTLLAVASACAPLALAQQPATPAPAANGLVSKSDAVAPKPADDVAVFKYLLGPGDVLDLRVFNEPQFSDKLQVTDEGTVEVPFVGAVRARCRTDVEVRKDITAALSKFLRNPQVSLRITEMKSRPPAVVFGAVRDPARYEMRRRVRLLDVLSVSGGVTEQAGGDIQVFHTEPEMCGPEGETTPAAQVAAADALNGNFSVYKLADLKLGKPEANPVIRPGDIIIVTEAPTVYMTGAVNSPTGLYLREKLQLTRAIAMVGGTKRDAKTSEVRIYRLKPETREQEVIKVNFDAIKKQKQPDIFLQPYDVVEVPEPGGLKLTLRDFFLRQGPTGILTGAMNAPLRVLY